MVNRKTAADPAIRTNVGGSIQTMNPFSTQNSNLPLPCFVCPDCDLHEPVKAVCMFNSSARTGQDEFHIHQRKCKTPATATARTLLNATRPSDDSAHSSFARDLRQFPTQAMPLKALATSATSPSASSMAAFRLAAMAQARACAQSNLGMSCDRDRGLFPRKTRPVALPAAGKQFGCKCDFDFQRSMSGISSQSSTGRAAHGFGLPSDGDSEMTTRRRFLTGAGVVPRLGLPGRILPAGYLRCRADGRTLDRPPSACSVAVPVNAARFTAVLTVSPAEHVPCLGIQRKLHGQLPMNST